VKALPRVPPPGRLLTVGLYLLALDGVWALHLGEFLGPVGLGVVLALFAGCPWASSWARGRRAGLLLSRVVAPLAAVLSVADVLVLSETALDGLVRLLLFLTLYKLLTLRSVRDTRTVAFLTFFMLVAAASSAFGVGFLFVFVAFVVLATWVLMLQETLGVSDTHRLVIVPSAAEHGRWSLLPLALGASAGAAAITAVLFFVIPRIGLAALPLRGAVGPMVTGFTDRVELGSYGQIETDRTVVMRVHLPATALNPERLPDLRWRGIAFDQFDGRAWTASHQERVPMRRATPGEFRIDIPRGTGPTLVQEVFLEPIGTDVVFGAPRPLAFRLRASEVHVDDMGVVTVPTALARLSYTVESELDLPPGRRPGARGRATDLDPEARARFLQLPSLPGRIPVLARQVAGDSREPAETAARLVEFLSREFRYTLALERQTGLEPLEEFLFVRRAGNCEYFAAALAVMLRSLGIPARVVGGFQRGEWNPYGRYFMVRLADAHSWVEAWLGGPTWTTLDPSPRAQLDLFARGGALGLYLDALRMRWHRYVVSWSIRDQVYAAVTIRREARAWRAWLGGLVERVDRRALAWAALLVVAAVALARWRGASLWPDRVARVRTVRLYEQALRQLARRGLRPMPAETAREFLTRVGGALPACREPFARVTDAYERCRFGGGTPTPGDAAALAACLASLRR
jgi:hypothetical protein